MVQGVGFRLLWGFRISGLGVRLQDSKCSEFGVRGG